MWNRRTAPRRCTSRCPIFGLGKSRSTRITQPISMRSALEGHFATSLPFVDCLSSEIALLGTQVEISLVFARLELERQLTLRVVLFRNVLFDLFDHGSRRSRRSGR